MHGKIILTSSYELKIIESSIFDEMLNGIHIHVLLEDHVCPDEKNLYKIFSKNEHPSIKCIFIQRGLMSEMKILDIVLRQNKLEGFQFFCPVCPIGTAQQF